MERLSGECQRTPLMISQYCFRQWLGDISSYHYLSQWWPRSTSLFGITSTQLVKILIKCCCCSYLRRCMTRCYGSSKKPTLRGWINCWNEFLSLWGEWDREISLLSWHSFCVILTHWSLGDASEFFVSNFQANCCDWCLRYLLWNCHQVIVTGPH